MKYYKIYASKQQLTHGLFVNFKDDQIRQDLQLIHGARIQDTVKTPLKFMIMKKSKSKTFSINGLEYLNLGGGGILIHDRAKKLFASLTKHHTMYKSQIEYQGEILPGPYYTMNLEVLRPAMEMEKSNFWKDEIRGEEHILSVDHLVLSQKKLDQISEDEHLFRLEEFTPIIIVDEYGKNLIEEAKIIGVEFREIEVAG